MHSFEPTLRPLPSPPPAPEAADLAACRALLRNGSRTFLAASLLLPRALRDPACALYAFCRQADDAVDLEPAGASAVERLRERLERVYRGRPLPIAADRALAGVVVRFGIPRALLEALLEGFEWDAAARRYESLDELNEYAARVAGSVGAMMALLMGVRSPQALARACDLGVAMQLSNIARDVGEDARMGRIYLPLQWLSEAGIDPDAWLARPVFSAALGAAVQRLLRAADVLYQRADDGIALLPLACRPGINAARFLYAEIGHEVARRGGNSVDQRIRVAPARKVALLVRALLAASRVRSGRGAPPLAATRFLVEAAATSLPRAPGAQTVGRWHLEDRVIRLIELFERLERSQRAQGSA